MVLLTPAGKVALFGSGPVRVLLPPDETVRPKTRGSKGGSKRKAAADPALDPAEAALFEAHRKYIDVQFVQSGRETILWAPLASMREETMAYDEKKDVALWKLVPDVTPVHLSAGHFVILFPEDAHAPTVVWETPTEVFKVVVKVKMA